MCWQQLEDVYNAGPGGDEEPISERPTGVLRLRCGCLAGTRRYSADNKVGFRTDLNSAGVYADSLRIRRERRPDLEQAVLLVNTNTFMMCSDVEFMLGESDETQMGVLAYILLMGQLRVTPGFQGCYYTSPRKEEEMKFSRS